MALEAHAIRDRAPMSTMFIGETVLIGQYIKPRIQMSYVCYIGVFSVKQCETVPPDRRFQKHCRVERMLYSLVF